jgi:GT2 family glycosyltransferase
MSNVTIAIPTYNRGPILVETIGKLLALEPRAAEILVVDQTKEHAPEIAAQLERWSQAGDIRWIRLTQPSVPGAMNEALRAARTPIVLFVDDDIVPSANLAIEHERAYAGGAWAVVGQVLQPGERVQHVDDARLHAGVLRDLDFRFNHDEPAEIENAIGCNLSVDRQRALSVGGFDENFLAAAYRFETDFARRVVAAGGRVRFEPRASIHHLHVPTGGIRAHGDHRTTANPSHSAGDYYFAMRHVPAFRRYVLRRIRQNVFTRFTLTRPWLIPLKVFAEVRGYLLARRLAAKR